MIRFAKAAVESKMVPEQSDTVHADVDAALEWTASRTTDQVQFTATSLHDRVH